MKFVKIAKKRCGGTLRLVEYENAKLELTHCRLILNVMIVLGSRFDFNHM